MEYWNDGKMEYWGREVDDDRILFSDQFYNCSCGVSEIRAVCIFVIARIISRNIFEKDQEFEGFMVNRGGCSYCAI